MDNDNTLDLLLMQGGHPTVIGSVAARLLQSGFDIAALRTNDVLRKEEWLLYDTAVVEVARANLVGVADLLSRNLRMDVTNAFGTTFVQWEKMSDMSDANVDMSGVTEGERDRVDFTLIGIPVPITHKDFQINIRALEASRKRGEPLDTTQATVSSRRVADSLESALFNGVTITAGGGSIPGYTNFSARNTGSVTAGWATATGEQIVGDVISMIAALQADNMFGPYMLYVPVLAFNNMLKDFKANSDKTTFQRVKEIPGIIDVKPTTQLAGNNVVMVQMTRDVVDEVVGFQPMPVMWESHGGMMVNVKVLAIMVPRMKSDYDGRCGIAHYS